MIALVSNYRALFPVIHIPKQKFIPAKYCNIGEPQKFFPAKSSKLSQPQVFSKKISLIIIELFYYSPIESLSAEVCTANKRIL